MSPRGQGLLRDAIHLAERSSKEVAICVGLRSPRGGSSPEGYIPSAGGGFVVADELAARIALCGGQGPAPRETCSAPGPSIV